MTKPNTNAAEHELILKRVLDAPKEKLYRCWTEPELIKQWFAPKPFSVSKVENDLRPGGGSTVVMRSPDGQEFPNPGIYLEVVPNKRLVFTDAFLPGYIPTGEPFMVAEVTFEDAPGGKTQYTAIARHWTAEAKQKHEQMGFHEGWGQCATQLEELAKTL
ncbi:MAG: SRPBCC family protein [Polyangiales bacterium]